LVSWHCERSATICRERCGGQGYLSCNRFGAAIAFAHASMTAEGDNRVLMQKVTKELLTFLRNGKYSFPSTSAPASLSFETATLNDLFHLFVKREKALLNSLANKLQSKMGAGSTLFDVWMKEESDLVQAVANAYGHRICLEQCIKVLALKELHERSIQQILTSIFTLYALRCIERDILDFISTGILTSNQVGQLGGVICKLCEQLAPKSLKLVDAFGIPAEVIATPIASDWIEFNKTDNKGEPQNNPRFF